MTEHIHQFNAIYPHEPGPFPRIKYRPAKVYDPYNGASVEDIPKGLISWRDKLNEKHCRACLRPDSVRGLTRHHLIPQSWWKKQGATFARYRNVAANVIPLCRPCHDEVESDLEARRMLRRVLMQEEIALAVALRGLSWLDGCYPR